MIRHRVRMQQHRRESGMTLVELVVAMAVSGILFAMISSMFVNAIRSYGDQRGSVTNSRMASNSMNELTRIIRAGTEIPVYGSAINTPVFVYAGSEQLKMNSFIDSENAADPAPLQVQFSRDANDNLVETRWTAYHVNTTYWAFHSTLDSTRIVARSLTAATDDAPLFSYYAEDGTRLVPPAGESLSDSQIRNIASVRVTMRVQTDGSGHVDPVELQNMVGIPNLGVARVEVD